MDAEGVERGSAAQAEEELYRAGLETKWHRRYGQRRDGLSRLSAYGSGIALLLGAAFAAAAVRWPSAFASGTVIAVLGAALSAVIFFQFANRGFAELERRAFRDLEGKREEPRPRKERASALAPFYPLAKLAVRRRVAFKNAWVGKRMDDFLARRAERERQADLFESSRVKLGSIHGKTGKGERTNLYHA
ncbi:MAG TPA: hypothetical protein VMH02_06945 [Verrucomicrobiae bacterium]|nr:hypothetical protein [Verrucomicrobiae bacterium]